MNEHPLGELISIQSGYAFKSNEYTNEGHFLVRIGNVQDGELSLENPKYVSLGKKTQKFELREGDFLTSLTGNIGRVARVSKENLPAALNQRVARLTVSDKSKLSDEYFYYFLRSDLFRNELTSISHGVAQQNVSPSEINNLSIPLPTIPEQQRIVAILDEAFAGIATATANAEKNLQNARELFESTLHSVFAEKGDDWEAKSLSEVCEITSNLVDPKETEFQDYKHIGAGNIVSTSKDLVDVKTAREEGLISGKFYFDTSMVLYSKIRPYLKKVAIPDFDGLCSADVYPLLPKKGDLNRDFLFYLLLSKEFTDYAIQGSQRAGMPKVNRDHLFRYTTYFPPVSEQRNISERLDRLSSESKKLEDIYQQKLDELALLKQSILQKAFAGELH